MNYSYKQIWFITFPVMMSVLVEQLINITDAIFLGHVGEIELGASAIAGIYYLVLYMMGFGFSLGLQVVIARRNGEGNYTQTGRTFFQGLYFLGALSITFILLSHWLTPLILQRLITSSEVYEAIISYLDWRVFGLLFAYPSLAFRSFLVGITQTRVMTVNALVMVATNLILNYILIFGKFDFPALGITGAAIASTCSEFASMVIFLLYALTQINRKKFGVRPTFDLEILKQVLRISVWSMMHSFISVAPWFLFFVAIEHLGQSELAISNIIRSIQALFSVIVNAFGATTASLVSNLIGAGEKKKVMSLCRKVLKSGYLLGIPLLILAVVFNKPLIGIYTNNTALVEGAFWPFIVMLSNFFLALPAFIYLNAVTGTGRTKTAFVFQAITTVFYLMYLWILSHCFDAPLAVYCTVEHLFVVLLLVMSVSWMCKDAKIHPTI